MAFRGKDYDFNAYSAGNKIYGGGRTSPHVGGGLDKLGYRERDLAHQARRNALLKRMQANSKKKFMSSEWLGGKHA